MDELLQYIIALLIADAPLGAIFQSAGAPAVSVLTPQTLTPAAYPRIIIEGEEGEQSSYSDGVAKFFTGKVRITINTRQSDACPDALATLRQIQNRCRDLLLGNKSLSLAGVFGLEINDSWRVDGWHQINPTRDLPVTDAALFRHLTTYWCKLNRRQA